MAKSAESFSIACVFFCILPSRPSRVAETPFIAWAFSVIISLIGGEDSMIEISVDSMEFSELSSSASPLQETRKQAEKNSLSCGLIKIKTHNALVNISLAQ